MRYHILRPTGSGSESSSSAAEADWIARSTGPGVIWARRFNDPANVTEFLGATSGQIATASQYIFQNPGDGIQGDGCLEMRWPQGSLPRYAWIRPLFPLPGDLNRPGLPVIPQAQGTPFYPDIFVNEDGGYHFVHADYVSASPWNTSGPPQPQIRHAGPFYLQFRVKFSASRFAAIENTNPFGDGTGKILILTGWYANCRQEIVLRANTHYGGGWYDQYTNIGSGVNAFLRDPQDNPSNAKIQPGGAYEATCTVDQTGSFRSNCWSYPFDQWVTMYMEITPGHKMVNGGSDWYTSSANDIARDTGIKVYAALPGDTSWTPVVNFPSFIFDYDGDYLSGASAQPYGWSVANFTPFNGGSDSQPVMSPNGYYHRFDEMICSTQPIAIPAVAGAPGWFAQMTEKTWVKLAEYSEFVAKIPTHPATAGNQTGASIVVGAFCGAAADQRRGSLLFLANGGHYDYAGNEGYEFTVRVEDPSWYRLTDRTPDNLINVSAVSGSQNVRVDYLDGLPRGMHTWVVPQYVPWTDKVVFAYTTDFSAPDSGNSSGTWLFHRGACGENYAAFPIPYATVAANGGNGAGIWRYGGLALSSPLPDNNDWEASPTCVDPLNRQVIGFLKTPNEVPIPGETAWAVDPDTGAVAAHFDVRPPSGNPLLVWAATTESTWPPLAVCGAYQSSSIYVWDLSKRSTTALVLKTPSGSFPALGDVQGYNPVWHAPSNAFVLYNQSSGGASLGLLKLNDPTNPAASTWTYSTVAPHASNTVVPPATGVNSYSKCNLIQDMGDGRACLVVASSAGVYAYKCPRGALS